MKLMLFVASILFMLSNVALAQEASREDFKELSRLLEGRWIADITWVEDWPGVGKKGEKATGYFDVKKEADGHALVGRHYAGTGAAIWMVAYDAADKKITGSFVVASGVYQMSYFKKNGTWMEESHGSLVDGRRTHGSSTITFSNNDTMMVLEGTGTTAGERQDDRRDIYRKVKPE